ncbi:hypothetical protein C7401_1372 [Paraburkholderia unamae]|uniref:hypothetical protein n=1 Tax=Paraburkholderia unamae TaxID=219649 RepID=UPI000DC24426|nr:hypothetical protein [Paraburkholderia unamae]RAR51462.1 hypothetical protein C7401_1372 [Paraburkholderia unamae]
MPDASRVGLRIWVTRDTLRALDARADAAHVPREDIAAALVVQGLAGRGETPHAAPATAEIQQFTRAAWNDAMTANPHVAPLLLRLLGDADR